MNKVGVLYPVRRDSPRGASTTVANAQGRLRVEGTNLLSLKIQASLSQSFTIKFNKPVGRIYCALWNKLCADLPLSQILRKNPLRVNQHVTFHQFYRHLTASD